MLRIDRIVKPWKESGALNAQIGLYGFWNQQTFLTKSGTWESFSASGASTIRVSIRLRRSTPLNGLKRH